MQLSASALGSYARCPMQFKFERIDGYSGSMLSATAYGSVSHHAIHSFERAMSDQGKDHAEATDIALATFDYYWHPTNIAEVADAAVEVWIRGDSYGSLRQRGLDAVAKYCDLWRFDQHDLLALEHEFTVPVVGTDHTLHGFIDKLSIRRKKGVPYLDCDDWKTGVKPTYLRHNLQLTTYAYASTQPEFWETFARVGADPKEMFERFAPLARHVNWYDLKSFRLTDAGFRGPIDYKRLAFACDGVARSVELQIFPLRISGETCQWCPFGGICPDGTGLPDDKHGAPGMEDA